MSAMDPLDSMQICVSTCPNETLRTVDDVKRYTARTNNSFCKYDFTDYRDGNFNKIGPCPELPIYSRSGNVPCLRMKAFGTVQIFCSQIFSENSLVPDLL